MSFLIGFLIFAVLLAAFCIVAAYICYRLAFFAPDRDPLAPVEVVPEGKAYEVFSENMKKWAQETADTPCREFDIKSFDGLTLHAKYYECKPGAPIELMFHGYRGNAVRDLSGGMQRCFCLGHNAFIVDQRCSGKSGGNVITFGINEHRDCLAWVDFMVKEFGEDAKIILCGISMGAATVLIASGCALPENVIGVLADCGYNSARDIINIVIKRKGLPVRLCYPFVKLGARLFGHFDLEEISPETALLNTKLPVIFFHGEDDDFVPVYMSEINYNVCASDKKRLVKIPAADHGLSYLVEPQRYIAELKDFFE